MKINIILIMLFIAITTSNIYSQCSDSTKTFEFNLGYTCDAGRNFIGGIKSGNALMGLINGGITINSNKFWKGGSLNFQVMNTHGRNLSENYVGDLQIISNIENGNYTFIENLFFRQDFTKLSVMAGLQDLNVEFCQSEFSSALTNSSFGIHITFPLHFHIPIYPKTALSLTGKYQFTENINIKAGIWDGDAGTLDTDPHNTDWSVSSSQGMFTIGEFEYTTDAGKHSCFKTGCMYHVDFEKEALVDTSPESRNLSIYAVFEREIIKIVNKSIGAFVRIASFPYNNDYSTAYMGAGLYCNGLFERRKEDSFSIAYTYSRYQDEIFECDIECNYQFCLGNHLSLQPVLHYVINPGANHEYENALAAFVRIYLSL